MRKIVLILAVVASAAAQTKIDLRTQGKSVDFSLATSTKPSKTGTAFPATCSIGETFFKTDAPAGANLYGCTAANIWSVQGSDNERAHNPHIGEDDYLELLERFKRWVLATFEALHILVVLALWLLPEARKVWDAVFNDKRHNKG
jgi:hypothetical protein